MKEEREFENYAIEINTFPEKNNAGVWGASTPEAALGSPLSQSPESAHPHIVHVYFIIK